MDEQNIAPSFKRKDMALLKLQSGFESRWGYDEAPSSSGKDVALRKIRPGFESRWGYKTKHHYYG